MYMNFSQLFHGYRKQPEAAAAAEVVVKTVTGQSYSVPNVEDIRRLEADLKRKTDLLTEVKVLLKQVSNAFAL
jgi:hypothetical protein